MCGIAGIIGEGARGARSLGWMSVPLAHRGPDDEGEWIDGDAGVGLAHRRLSIVDLSACGHQPMESADERYVIVYNGEIYNHAGLRAAVEAGGGGPGGNGWRGHSDTETLIEAIALWGLEATLAKCVGMFALALWDRKERQLLLARDRFGEKPLYYGWVGKDFLFASELKALRGHSRFDNEVDRRALRLLATRLYIPAPLTIYRRIYKLEPGCILSVSPEAWRTPLEQAPHVNGNNSDVRLHRYWSYRQVVQNGLAEPIGGEAEAIDRLEQVLAEAVKGQSMADVPVGAFLSGGFDSSTVVAIYQKYSSQTVRTFSIGFEEAGYDEAPYAREVARHFGTSHNEHYVTAREALDVIPSLPAIYDEPFADSSQIPTHLVCRFAREQVTVALSGDGGDELFGGYNRYFATARLWSHLARLPAPVRAAAAGSLGRLPPSFWNGLVRLLPHGRRPPYFGVKVQKSFRTMARASSLEPVFSSFLEEWWGEPAPVIGGDALNGCAFDLDVGVPAPDTVRMMYCDAVSYLPDDILCKVDRAAMAVSLETRVPFLDHRVAELAARIPIEMKIRGGKGKQILRKLLYREAPAQMFERPKAGFGIPLGEWLRGPLRPWAEELLGPKLEEGGFFDTASVRKCWRQHVDGERDAAQAIWAILMFQAWRTAGTTV